MATGDTALMDAVAAGGVPEVESAPVETQETDIGAEGSQPAEQQPEQQVSSFDAGGKPNPQALKSAFAKLSEGDKKLADHIRGQYFENQSIRQMFPGGLSEIRNLRETFEAMGGSDGVEQAHQDAQEFAETLTRVASGDPSIIDEIANESREGFPKLATAAFDKLRQIDPQMHSTLAMSAFSDVLRQSGFPDGLNTLAGGLAALVEDIYGGKQSEALNAARNLAAWFDKFKAMGVRQAQNGNDPQREQLETEKKQIATEKENLYRTNFNTSLNKQVVIPAFQKHMAEFLKTRTLSQQQKGKFEQEFYSEIAKEFSEESFTKKRDMLMQRHDDKALMNLYKPRVAELAPKIFKRVRDSLGYSVGTQQKTAAAAPAVSFGKKPEASEIDWSKDRNQARYMGRRDSQDRMIGEATLKNGKTVRWDWNAV